MTKKNKIGRPKGSVNKKRSNKDIQEDVMRELLAENKLLQEEIEEYQENQEKVAPVIANMQSFQHKAIDYLFALVLILSVFNFLG